MTKLPETAIPVRLISQGRISRRDPQDIFNYRYADGSMVDSTRQMKSKYWRIKGKERGETIYRIPSKICWELERKIEQSPTSPTQTYRMYLWTDIDDEKEASQLMKDIWTTRTTFPDADSWIPKKITDLSKPLDEDEIKIMSDYSHYEGYRYINRWKVKTTNKTLSLSSKIAISEDEKTDAKREGFANIKEHDHAEMRTDKDGGDRRVYGKARQRVGRKKK